MNNSQSSHRDSGVPRVWIAGTRLATWAMLGILFFQSISVAKPTTAKQAAAVVQGWLRLEVHPMRSAIGRQVASVMTYKDAAGKPIYYIVYVNPSGFVIVPADDLVEPIIGFVSTGRYDPSARNPLGALVTSDLAGRMALARKGIRAATGGGLKPKSMDAPGKWNLLQNSAAGGVLPRGLSSISDVRVDALVQSEWDQTTVAGAACYNYYTPPGPDGSARNNYPCGCVATAMAQLMRFWSYPTQGVGNGSRSYEVEDQPQQGNLKGGDGAGGPYNWTAMELKPSSSTSLTTTQRQAIGALCYDAGLSVHMDYNQLDIFGNPSGQSGADTLAAADAFKGTFSYSNAIKGYNRENNIDSNGLISMLNPDLDAGFPALLGITGTSGGHAIVCDGYGYNISTLYHHLNMGWSGNSNAWYNLPNIDAAIAFTSVYRCVYNVYQTGSGEIISGRVLASDGSAPVSGATVTANRSGGGTYTATSNNKGIYALAKIPSASQYHITVSQSGLTFPARDVSTGTSAPYSTSSGNLWGVDFVAGGCVDNSLYVADITVPDDTSFAPNQSFTKTWRIKNNGSCSWGSGYKWTFDGGDKMSGPDSIDVPNISPGSTWDPSVNLTAPGSSGTYRGYWRMQAPNGTKFGTQVWVEINVQGGCTSNNAVFKAPPGNTGAQTLPEFNDYGWVQRGQTFPITFYAYNTGDCTWQSGSDYCLHHNAAAPNGPMQWCETVDWTCAPQNAWTTTLGITASQTPGTYRVTARMMKAGNEFGNYVNWDFHVNSPPGKPTLTGPGNGSTVYGPTVAFSWNDPGDTDNGPRNSRDYVLEVFNSSGTKILGTDWIFDRSFSYTLPGPGTYSWRVHAGDGLDVSDWSDQWSFTYSNKGTLTISTNTNTLCGLNAEVLVNGTSWGTAPQSRTLDAGTYTVSFGAVAGWNTPGNQSATVTAGQTTSIVGTYGDAGLPDITITQSPTANTCIASGQVCYTATDAQCGTPTVTYAWDSGVFSATPASGCIPIPDGNHTLHLHAVDSVGNVRDATAGPFSVDATPPAAPTGLAATLDHYTATLTWTAADSTGCAAVAGYNVYRKRSDGGGYAKVNGDLATATKYTDRAANGVAYDYGVTAVDTFSREGPMAELKSQVVGKRGDLNGDGQIDITDVIMLINLINRGNLTPVEQALGDFNGDGKVDANDVEAMKKYILGK